MYRIGVIQRMIMRRTGGFVIALHEMPAARLERFVEALRPAEPVQLSEIICRRKEGKSCAGLFAITIDDGVGENVRGLAKLFRARQWPATFYLPTRYLDTGVPMPFQLWWQMKPFLPRQKLKLMSETVDFSSSRELHAFAQRIERMWYRERQEAYLPLTMELMKVIAPNAPKGPAPISWKEVEELGRDDLIRFESHGVSHTAMSALNKDELAFEMKHSQEVIAEHTGKPCRHFCYPFGSTESIGAMAPKIARRYYDSAVTMNLGSVEVADPWLLPRIPLYPKNSLLFARTKILLKCPAVPRNAPTEPDGQASKAQTS